MSAHAGRRVLIAGCGDLGARLARVLVDEGATVFALRRGDAVPDGVAILRADLTRDDDWPALPDALDAVVFCAAPSSRDEAAYRALYVGGLVRLLDRARPTLDAFARVVFASSTAVWGELGGAWVDEETPAAPDAFNGAVMLEAEQALAGSGLDTVAVRLAGLYGPGRTMLLRRLDAREPVIADPPQWTNRIHVDDAARAVAHVLALPDAAPLYVAVDDAPAPLHEVLDFLAQRRGVAPLPRAPGGEAMGNKRLSNRKLRLTGFDFRYPDYRAGYA